MAAPILFISYSHDSTDHKAWVLKLASDLRALGIDAKLDQWDLAPGQDVSLFMERGISSADRVIMVCSSKYVSKAEAGSGGVGYERTIVTAEMVQSIDTTKFIPVLRGSDSTKPVPKFLGTRLYVNFESDSDYQAQLEALAREVHGAPAIARPPLGPNPFSASPPAATPPRLPGPTGTTPSPEAFLGSTWFVQEQAKAKLGISNLGLKGEMELRFAIAHSVSKSQIELLNAVQQSEIRTFGWPIGITLENREEFRPRAYGDGIRAEVSIPGSGDKDRTSYDYWAFRSNGDFYLLQSLFEDNRAEKKVFFDTRIIRVTESLMFAERIYTKLGAPPETRVGVRVTHRGLDGRELVSASRNRFVSGETTQESELECEIVTVLGTMKQTRVADVRKLLEPLFMIFNFQQFNPAVYEEIVTNFEKGKIS